MELKDMKRSPKEKKAEETALTKSEPEEYPWGLQLNLDKESLDKLGVSFAVGMEVNIQAIGKVVSVSESASERGDNKSAELQITSLAVEKKSETAQAESLFGGKKS